MRLARQTRRQFLGLTGLALGGLVFDRATSSGQEVAPVKKPLKALPTVVVRKNAKTLTNAEIDQLKKAFQAIRDRTVSMPSNPTGWLNQANIHDNFCNTDDPNVEVHFSWWFLPWHRAYLYFFEKILQDAASDPNLALPYWDWTNDHQIPASFWGACNPLFDPNRVKTATSTVPSGPVQVAGILNIPTFNVFGGDSVPFQSPGQLESGPHNYVHGWIGGDMGRFATAARDPLFWLHHANIDRLWEMWVKKSPSHVNPTSANWLQRQFSFFSPQGNPATIRVDQTLDTVNSLDYRYDDVPGTLIAFKPPERLLMMPPIKIPPQPDRQPITTPPLTVLPEALRRIMAAQPKAPTPVELHIQGIELPEKEPLHVRVFINKEDANAQTSTEDPHFVGSFTFLPMGQHKMAAHPPVAAVLDVSQKLPKLLKDTSKVSLTLVPMKIDETGPAAIPLKAKTFSLAVHEQKTAEK
jgi:polyphenol oxidase